MKGTKEQKALYHALVGGIMSKLTSGDFLAGASATAINKLVIGEIEKLLVKDPAMMQWLSALLGGVISEVVSKTQKQVLVPHLVLRRIMIWIRNYLQNLDTYQKLKRK